MKTRILSILTALAVVIAIVPINAVGAAEDEFVINEDGVLTEYNGAGGEVVIPCGVTAIGDGAFMNCAGVTSVIMPNSVIIIGNSAFQNCTGLTSVKISDNILKIGSYAFMSCVSMSSITIPKDMRLYFLPNTSSPSLGEKAVGFYDDGGVITKMEGFIIYGFDISVENYAIKWGFEFRRPASFSINENGVLTQCFNGIGDVVIPSGVTSIGMHAFDNNALLTSVTIPDTVTKIDSSAFRGCVGLTEITIPDSVTSIKDCAFLDCLNLTAITIPNSVTNIGVKALGYYFDGDVYIKTENFIIYGERGSAAETYARNNGFTFRQIGYVPEAVFVIDENGKLIKYNGKGGDAVVPDGVTAIADWVFYDCAGLTSVTIPEGVTAIGDGAFEDCINLTSITLPNSLETIGNCAFNGCVSLSAVTIPDGVVSIGNCAFQNCESLTEITVPDGVTEIGKWTFMGCAGLAEITLPDGVTNVARGAFFDCESLTEITLPQTVVEIGWEAFTGCESLTSITIPDSAESIGWRAFVGCKALAEITVGGGVTNIDLSVFLVCTSLTSINVSEENTACSSVDGVLFDKAQSALIQYPQGKTDSEYTIPDGVTEIGRMAFNDCVSLTAVTVPDSVVTIGESALGYYYSYDKYDGSEDSDGSDNSYKVWNNVKTEDFTIYGGIGSAAEAYAAENGFIFLETGAVIGDFVIGRIVGVDKTTIFDALEILKYLVGMDSAIKDGNAAFKAACITGGDEPTVFDALEILKYLVGMPSKVR